MLTMFKFVIVLLFSWPMLAVSAGPKLTDGMVVFLGNSGEGKSTLSSLLLAKGLEEFVSSSDPASCTTECCAKDSFINKWQVVDTPGLDDNSSRPRQLIFEEILSAFSLSKGDYKLCFILSPHNGRLGREQMETINSILGAFSKKPRFYVVVNCSPMDREYQKKFLDELYSFLDYCFKIAPQDVLFLPKVQNMRDCEVAQLKNSLRKFVKSMKSDRLSEITKVDRSDEERRALIRGFDEAMKKKLEDASSKKLDLKYSHHHWQSLAIPAAVVILGYTLYCIWQ